MKDILANNTYVGDIREILENFDFSVFENRTVLVTGGLGLICSSVVDLMIIYNECCNANISVYSLTKQTTKDFEWLIVDDGSSDNTEELVNAWIKENLVHIRYIKQKNGGKMKAHNTGVLNTESELFFCVDSDDYIVDTAVEIILNKWNSLSISEQEALAGMVGYRGVSKNVPIGNKFPENVERDSLSGFYQKGLSGDTSLVFKTEVIKKFPFPIIGNEKFITEAYVYDQIDQYYQLCAIPEVITVCEYREDGLTQNLLSITFRNPCGYVAYNLQRGNFAKSKRDIFLYYVRASAFSKFTRQIEMPVFPSCKWLYAISYPFGKLFFMHKKKLYAEIQKRTKNE